MRILQVSHRVPWPLNEGGTIGIYNYTRGFSELGCDVTLFALAARKHKINIVEAQSELSKYARVHIYSINTDVKPIPALLNLFSSASYNVERFYDPSFDEALQNELNENSYDVIQIEGTFAAVYSETVFRHKGNAKVILRQHNVEYQIWERIAATTTNPLKKWYLNLLSKRLKDFEKKHLNQYDALVPVTPDDGQLFQALGCTIPVYDSPAGIDIEVWKPSIKSNALHMYHMGSLEWMPNLDAVEWFSEEIWPRIHSSVPEAACYIAGKGMPEEMKSRRIEGMHFIGEVDSAPEFIKAMGISIVPLRSGSGIRLKILEAMAAGKAVVSTTIGAQGIHYSDKKNIWIADTPKAFSQAVIDLITNDGIRLEMQQEARKLIESQYSNQSVVKRLIDFYESL